MKDFVLELAVAKTGYNQKLNTIREYLQSYILRIMHNAGVFRYTAFLGGTALRFLYHIPRFSEDLDFSIERNISYNFTDLVKKIKQELELAGYKVFISYNDEKTVQNALIKFEGLLYEAGISSRKEQRLSIKIEIDTNPPKGAIVKTDIVNIYFPLSFLSYDVPSLFAGKLHALLSRRYTKGRDFFDLGWYLSRWKDIVPNINLLQNALKQTRWTGEMPTAHTWRDFIYRIVKKTDWGKVNHDVTNFLEDPSMMDVFTQENVLNLLKPINF